VPSIVNTLIIDIIASVASEKIHNSVLLYIEEAYSVGHSVYGYGMFFAGFCPLLLPGSASGSERQGYCDTNCRSAYAVY